MEKSMCSQPLVSVVISTYNDEKYINEAIKSILCQTYKNLEVIVINDASSDNTAKVLEHISDDRMRIFHNKENLKLAHNLNVGISKSTGKYIARMDADDIALPDRIAQQVLYMESHPEVDVCGSYVKAFGNADNVMSYPVSQEEIKVRLLFENTLCHPSVMFRKESIDFEYDESFSAAQDHELWSRIVWNKQIRNIPEVLLKYRIHKGQTKYTSGASQKKGALAARTNMLHKLIPNMPEKEMDVFLKLPMDKKTKAEMKEAETVLLYILKVNADSNIFSQNILFDYCAFAYYQAWYRSLGTGEIDYKLIKNSSFFSGYKKQPVIKKVKAVVKLILQKIRCEKEDK